MGDKSIDLSDDAYKRLSSLKREGESFTDVILRLCSKTVKRPLASFTGAWTMNEEEEKELFSEIAELWKKPERLSMKVKG